MKTENNFKLKKMLKFTEFCNFKRPLGKINGFRVFKAHFLIKRTFISFSYKKDVHHREKFGVISWVEKNMKSCQNKGFFKQKFSEADKANIDCSNKHSC